MAWAVVCVAVCMAAWAGGARAEGLCSDGAAFHALVASANASGHWRATLDLHRDDRLLGRADAVRLDVRPLATLCGDVRTVAMTVELRGSSPAAHIATTASPGAAGARVAAPPAELGYARAPPFPGFYKVHAQRVDWRAAKEACEAEGAHLAIVESKEEAQALAFLLRPHARALTRTLHAGFFAANTQYFTLLGERLSEVEYQRWAEGEPRQLDICGGMDHAGALLDAFCSWNVKRSFVCEYGGPPAASRGVRRAIRLPRPASPAPAPAPAPTVPGSAHYTRLPGASAYQVREENATWAEALAACQAAGGQLAVAETEGEAVALRQHLAQRPAPLPPLLHVGLYAESRFVTVFGDDLSDSEYQGWAEGEPNNHPCVVANHDLSFISVGCSLKTAFICEQANTV